MDFHNRAAAARRLLALGRDRAPGVGAAALVGLRIVDGLSYEEVAARLNCSEDAARAHVSRGLRGLQRALGPTTLTQGA